MKVKLLKPHTHAGRDYRAGAHLEVDADTAEWLRLQGVVASPPVSAAPTPSPTLPTHEEAQ